MARLTNSVVSTAKPAPYKAQTLLYDEDLKGFGLRITHNGVKSFIVEYRTKAGSKHRQTIGRYGVLTSDQARKRAKDILADVTKGNDPANEIKAKKAEVTVHELLDQFVAEHVAHQNKPRTQREVQRLINTRIKPKLGGLKLSALTRARIKTWHSDSASTPFSANRALAHLQRACRFAIEHGFATDNPCRGITRFKEKAKDRFFLDEELKRIGKALHELENAKVLLPTVALGIRLMALTGLRATEARLLQWSDFDTMQEVLRLADAKSGARAVPLFDEAVTLLNNASRVGEYIVLGSDPEKPVSERSFSKGFERVLARAQVKGASLHTLRHTVATYMAQHGDSAPLIAASGGWKTLTMVQRYVNMQSVGKRHPMPAGARIATALDGKSTELIGQPGTATAVSNGKHTFPEPAIESSKALKPRRGRPKVPWEPVADELDRRLKAGKALPTVTAESKYLHEWSKNNQNRFKQYAISASGKKDMMVNSPERISVRIKKRIGSSQLYRDKREEHLSRLQSMATKN